MSPLKSPLFSSRVILLARRRRRRRKARLLLWYASSLLSAFLCVSQRRAESVWCVKRVFEYSLSERSVLISMMWQEWCTEELPHKNKKIDEIFCDSSSRFLFCLFFFSSSSSFSSVHHSLYSLRKNCAPLSLSLLSQKKYKKKEREKIVHETLIFTHANAP